MMAPQAKIWNFLTRYLSASIKIDISENKFGGARGKTFDHLIPHLAAQYKLVVQRTKMVAPQAKFFDLLTRFVEAPI